MIKPIEPTSKPKEELSIGLVIALFVMAVMAYGLVIAGLQVYLWATSGTWYQAPLRSLFVPLDGNTPSLLAAWLPTEPLSKELSVWLQHPSSWLGVHQIVNWALSSGGVAYTFFFGGWLLWFGFLVLSERVPFLNAPNEHER